MRVLVIGNGFDKQHGLKTGYYDFIAFCESILNVKRSCYNNQDLQLYMGTKHQYAEYFYEFEDLVDNVWINHFINEKNSIPDMWLNFESEIENVIKGIQAERIAAKNNGISDDKIVSNSKNYEWAGKFSTYAKVFKYLTEELKKLIRALDIYLSIQVKKDLDEGKKVPAIMNLEADKIISFNYTGTYPLFYDGTADFDFVHGAISMDGPSEECNMVLGFDDHYNPDSRPVLDIVPFEKYYQRIVNKTGNDYMHWFEEAKDDIELYFYGHSLSPADGDILRNIILHNKVVKTTIFWRKGHKDDFSSMVQNLAVVLTPEVLIRRAGGRHPVIEFKEVEI